MRSPQPNKLIKKTLTNARGATKAVVLYVNDASLTATPLAAK